MLKAGFGRIDITPPLGTYIAGYFDPRYANGVLDPLMATAVVFDDGERRAVIISVDNIGLNQYYMDELRPAVAEAVGTVREGVFVHATHIHTGAAVAEASSGEGVSRSPEYAKWLIKRIVDAATLAVNDLAPAKMFYTKGEVRDVAFVRRFRMKNGEVRTNPGWQNPDIDHALGTPDEES
ncbi:MAG: neutral/alkaline non-lysosomal ceramidase N-terminal domain-containing protein, partial [Oscillospiraceae bacterium]|nr:neutral/alkaline non-lysosomal ceramidase N-terminal domain-containing protein [Oscillospiraceae bacterium]